MSLQSFNNFQTFCVLHCHLRFDLTFKLKYSAWNYLYSHTIICYSDILFYRQILKKSICSNIEANIIVDISQSLCLLFLNFSMREFARWLLQNFANGKRKRTWNRKYRRENLVTSGFVILVTQNFETISYFACHRLPSHMQEWVLNTTTWTFAS